MSTFLLPLDVARLGEPDVETFASYFGRLAKHNGMSRSQLTRLLIARQAKLTGKAPDISETPVYATHGTGLFGYRERVDAYVDLIGEASGQECLRRTTLIPIRHALASQCNNSIKPNRAWCEQCFRHDILERGYVYDRLLWTLAPLHRCKQHRLKLRTICPSCSSVQRYHHRTGDPGICVKCGRSLIGPAIDLVPMLEADFGEGDCHALVAAISAGELDQIGIDPFYEFEKVLMQIFRPLGHLVTEISAISGSARSMKKRVNPSLKTMLKKCFAAGVSLADVLRDPEGAAKCSGQLFFDRYEIPAEARPRHDDEVREEVETVMRGYLAKPRSEPIPGLRQVASSLGVSVGYIRHNFDELVKPYQAHRWAANISKVLRLQAECRRELERILCDPGEAALLANRKRLEAHLVRATGCTVPQARHQIRIGCDGWSSSGGGRPDVGSRKGE